MKQNRAYIPEDNIFRLLLDDTLAGYWDWNFKEKTGYLSPTFKKMLGHENDDSPVTIENWHKIIFPQDLERLNSNLKEHIDSHGKIPHRQEVRYRHKDGHTVWVLAIGRVVEWDENLQPVRIVGCHIDISRQKKTEQELKISERQFKGAFENSAIGMALVSLDGYWLMVNKQVCQLLGYPEEELLQMTFQQVTHPDDLDLDLGYVHQVLDNKLDNYQIEKRYFHKNGETIWVQLNVSLVKDPEGQPLHFVSQIQDVTRRRIAQENLESLTEKLTIRNKKLGDFAHIASHNLRAPVSNLTTLVKMYQQLNDISEKQVVFGNFEKVVNHLSSTLNDLIDTLKIQEDFDQIREEIRFEEVLNKTCEIIIGQIEETNTKLDFDFSEAPTIVYHRPYLESIFLNLITNAIKYRSPDRTPHIRVHSGILGQTTFLKFEDNGLGINLERHGHKIFGLHKTFHRHKEAKGVGLFMTRTQVEAMGGTITVESVEGKGSSFTILF